MKNSIIIATYNRSSLISNSIQSVLNQTYADWELIVADDGSTDDTREVVEAFLQQDERVRYIALKENKGATTARNRGIAEATGDLIMVWDSDDELYPRALERVVNEFRSQPDIGIVSVPCAQRLPDGTEKEYRNVASGRITLEQIVCKHLPDNEKVRVAKAEIFKQVKYEARNIDFTVNGYLASLGQWYHIGEELGVLNLELDEVSLTANRKQPNAKRSVERVEPLLRYFENFGELVKANCPKRYAALCYGLSLGLLLKGEKEKARQYAREAVHFDGIAKHKRLKWLTKTPGGATILRILYKMRQ